MNFKGFERASAAFDRALNQFDTGFQYIDLDLSIVRNGEVITIAGDFLYIDKISTGHAIIEFNNQMETPKAPFYVGRDFSYQGVFTQIKVTNTQQWDTNIDGSKLRIMYAHGAKISPSSSEVSVINTVLTKAGDYGYEFASASNTPLLAAAPENFCIVGVNFKGLLIKQASFSSVKATWGNTALIAKATAPTAFNDGIVLLSSSGGSLTTEGGRLARPVEVPAGLGLWWYTNVNETNGQRSVLFDIYV